MALTQINQPSPQFTDLDGSPLDNGFVYIGQTNLDPETNPITVYWDYALTIVAEQPIRTSSGYPWRNGAPAPVYTTTDFYSITIRNSRRELVITEAIAPNIAIIPVNRGGTGTDTLTGYVYGNGTDPMTASTVIPASDVVGFGTMALQDADSIAVTGGTADNLAIGASTLTSPTVTNYTETLFSVVSGSAQTVDLSNGTVQKFITTSNIAITLPASIAGKSFVVIVYYGGTHSVTWTGGGTLKWVGGTIPVTTSTSGKADIFTFFQDGTNTYAAPFGLNF